MRDITDFDGNIEPVSVTYPSGDIKDNSGLNDGTRVNRKMLADIFQTIWKFVRGHGETPNGDADNEVNGYQMYEVIRGQLHDPGEIYQYNRAVGLIDFSGKKNPLIQASTTGTGDIGLADSQDDTEQDRQTITIVNNSTTNLTLSPGGSDTIGGGSSLVVASGGNAKICLDKTNQDYIILYNNS